jgi:hypothetical protein
MKNRLFMLFAMFTLATMVVFGADISGKWMSEAPANGKGGPQTFNLKQDGALLTGTIEGGRGGPLELKNGKVDGDKIYFEVTREMQGNSITIKYTGHVTATDMTLSFDAGRGPRDMKLTKQ